MNCVICGANESWRGRCIEINHVGEVISVMDSDLGKRSGSILGVNPEGHLLVSFENPPVVVFEDMIIKEESN